LPLVLLERSWWAGFNRIYLVTQSMWLPTYAINHSFSNDNQLVIRNPLLWVVVFFNYTLSNQVVVPLVLFCKVGILLTPPNSNLLSFCISWYLLGVGMRFCLDSFNLQLWLHCGLKSIGFSNFLDCFCDAQLFSCGNDSPSM
jgi:hypothetical protein